MDSTSLCLVPETLITWAAGDYRGNYDDFIGDFNTNFYDYSSSVGDTDSDSNYDYYSYGNGITGANVLDEMRPNPTRPSFITGSNVIR